jgi:hypothetical protein
MTLSPFALRDLIAYHYCPNTVIAIVVDLDYGIVEAQERENDSEANALTSERDFWIGFAHRTWGITFRSAVDGGLTADWPDKLPSTEALE